MNLGDDVIHYRKMAQVTQHQLDHLSPKKRADPSRVARLTTERDQWTALADELERYLDGYDEGSWPEPDDASGLF